MVVYDLATVIMEEYKFTTENGDTSAITHGIVTRQTSPASVLDLEELVPFGQDTTISTPTTTNISNTTITTITT